MSDGKFTSDWLGVDTGHALEVSDGTLTEECFLCPAFTLGGRQDERPLGGEECEFANKPDGRLIKPGVLGSA
jgi:hypothetical protein